MDIRKSGLENNSGSQEKWYVFDDHNLVIGEFFLPKIWSDDFARFLTMRAADLAVCTCDEPIPTREFRTCNRCEKRISPSR